MSYILGATNRIINPSYETNTTGWSTGVISVTGTWARTQEWAYAGTWSHGFTVTSVASIGAITYNFTSAFLVVVPGQDFSMKVRTRVTNVNLVPYIRFEWQNSGGGLIQAVEEAQVNSVPNKDREHFFSSTAPALAVRLVVSVRVRFNATGLAGEKVYLDGWDGRDGAVVDTYIDGSQGSIYHWTGTAHASTSFRDAQIATKLSGRDGTIKLSRSLYLVDQLNNIQDDISDIILTGQVDMSIDRDIKMNFNGSFLKPFQVRAYRDYLAPVLQLEYSDGSIIRNQMGVYSIAPLPGTFYRSYVTGDFKAYDLLWNLSQATFSGRYSVPSGDNYNDAIITVLLSEGFSKWAIPDNGKALPTSWTWKATDSKLKIINDLLQAIGYYTLFCGNDGTLTSFPYTDMLTVEPAMKLVSGDGSTVVGSIRKEPLTDGIVNFVKAVKEDGSNVANSFYYEQRNTNLDSPVSTVSLGRTISGEISASDIADLATAKSRVQQALQEAASLYTKYEVTTLPDPRRSVFEVLDTDISMNDGTEILKGKVRCNAFTTGFSAQDAVTVLKLNRLELI